MSDSEFVDVGDELVVRISGYPVGTARVFQVDDDGVKVEIKHPTKPRLIFTLPLDVKDYDTVDGYGHGSQPLSGTAETCGAWGGCELPVGHNMGKADVPEAHLMRSCRKHPHWSGMSNDCVFCKHEAPVVNDFGEDVNGDYIENWKGPSSDFGWYRCHGCEASFDDRGTDSHEKDCPMTCKRNGCDIHTHGRLLMENPMSWGPVENTIHKARIEWEEAHEKGVCGASLEMLIANALRAEGLIVDL